MGRDCEQASNFNQHPAAEIDQPRCNKAILLDISVVSPDQSSAPNSQSIGSTVAGRLRIGPRGTPSSSSNIAGFTEIVMGNGSDAWLLAENVGQRSCAHCIFEEQGNREDGTVRPGNRQARSGRAGNRPHAWLGLGVQSRV